MASTSETGHAKNVANFQDLIEFVTGYGATYNPSKNSLKLPQLIALKASSAQTPTDPNTPAPTTISTSQQSYDQLIQHLAGLNSVLEAEPSYTPNETDLQVATVQAKIADLTAKNTAVATAYTSISNSRIARNETLYSSTTGLVETANEVKKYVKSVFGASSPQFAQVKGIEFKKPKI